MELHAGQVADHPERRAGPRARVLKHARIVFNGGYVTFDCTIRNMSPAGAMLLFGAPPLGIPAHFDLLMGAGRPHRPCTVRWKSDSAIGVSFDAIH